MNIKSQVIKKFSVIVFAFVSLMILLTSSASAAVPSQCQNNFLGIPQWYQYLNVEYVDGQCNIKTESEEGWVVILIILGIFDIVLYVAGFAAVVFVIWGGYKFLTSTGEPQKIASARTTILNALVGLAIAFIASTIVGFIAGRLT